MLKLRCDRDELSEAFVAAQGIIPASQPLKPILLNFHLRTEDGQLVVEATDLDVGVRIRVERVEILEDGELALPGQRMTSLVKELPQKELVFEALPEENGVTLRGEGYEFQVLGDDPREFPEMPTAKSDEGVGVSRDKFVEVLRRVAIAASRDPSRYQLTGVFFEIDGERLTLTATDGKRLTNDQMRVENSAGVEAKGIVPNRAVDTLLKVVLQGDSEIRLVIGEANLQVRFGKGDLTAKLIQGAYPDYKVAVGQPVAARVTAKRNDFLSAARSAALMTDRDTNTVIFSFREGSAFLSTQARSIGASRIEVPISLQGEPVEIRFNPTYFVDALRCVTEDDVRFEFLASNKPGTVRGGQHYRHMLMPLVV
jgi:DNA polymerase-3 subunit beta